MIKKLIHLILLGGLVMSLSAQTLTYENRDDIPVKYKWKLFDVYASDEDWNSEYDGLSKMIPELKSYSGKLAEDSESLAEFIGKYMDAYKKLDRLYGYAHMKSDQNIAVNKYKDMVTKMRNLYSEMGQAVAFFEPELMDMGEEKLASFVDDNDELKEYEHYFDDIMRMKAHTLSTEMEELMALSGPMRSTAGNVYSMMNNVDFVFPEMKDEKGEKVQITHGLYGKFMQSPDRRVRKDVYMGIHSVYQDFKNTLAANYTGVINAQIFNSKARKYKTTREAALKGNAVPEKIYDNLIKSVNDNLDPLHRYVSLRKKLLKLEDGVHDYDLRTSMFVKKESNYTWEEAMELVSKGVAPILRG